MLRTRRAPGEALRDPGPPQRPRCRRVRVPPAPARPPVAMGTGAGARHAGLKETAAVKCYESSGCWPMSARGGGGGDQWLVASREGAGLGALGGDGGGRGSVKPPRRRSELCVRFPLCPARSVSRRAAPVAPAER